MTPGQGGPSQAERGRSAGGSGRSLQSVAPVGANTPRPTRAAPWTERVTALAAVVVVPLALRLLPLRMVLAVCDRWPSVAPHPARPAALADRVRRWLERGRGPWRSTCLTRSAVLYAMLRQHGHVAGFCVGVSGTSARFEAHAWVTVNGTAIDQPAGTAEQYRLLLAHHA